MQVACQLLQYSQGRSEQGDKVMRALAAAAQAALAVNAATTAAVADALRAAETAAAGQLLALAVHKCLHAHSYPSGLFILWEVECPAVHSCLLPVTGIRDFRALVL